MRRLSKPFHEILLILKRVLGLFRSLPGLRRVWRYYNHLRSAYRLAVNIYLEEEDIPVSQEPEACALKGSSLTLAWIFLFPPKVPLDGAILLVKDLGAQGQVEFIENASRVTQEAANAAPMVFVGRLPQEGKGLNEFISAVNADIIALVDASVPWQQENFALSTPWLRQRFCLNPSLQYCVLPEQELASWQRVHLSMRYGHHGRWRYRAIAFRKSAWAEAGGFPFDLPLDLAWQIFALRLGELEGTYTVCPLWQIGTDRLEKLAFTEAFARGKMDGSVGLAPWPHVGVSRTSVAQFLRSMIKEKEFFAVFSVVVLYLVYLGGYAFGAAQRDKQLEGLKREYEKQLREILTRHESDTLGVVVYLPTHDWSGLFQRPHQMIRHLAQAGFLCFFCTPNQRDFIVGFKPIESRLFLAAVPPEVFACLEKFVLYVGSPWYAEHTSWFPQALLIYDHFDDLAVSSGLVKHHLRLLQQADIVIVSSQVLYNKVTLYRQDALLLANAADFSRIQQLCHRPLVLKDAERIKRLASGRPIVGYMGALAQWMDYALLDSVVSAHPEWLFVFVGEDYDGSFPRSALPERENVVWLGPKPYEELFLIVREFDVGIIPFALNEITKAVSPVKLFEYFACGIPVVSTPLPECQRIPEVFLGATSEEFGAQIQKALEFKENPDFRQRLHQVAQQNTWSARVDELVQRIKEVW